MSRHEQQRLAARAKAISVINKLDAKIKDLSQRLASKKAEQQKARCSKCGTLEARMLEKKLQALLQARSKYPKLST